MAKKVETLSCFLLFSVFFFVFTNRVVYWVLIKQTELLFFFKYMLITKNTMLVGFCLVG